MLDPVSDFDAAVRTFNQAAAAFEHGTLNQGDQVQLRHTLDAAFHEAKRLAPAAVEKNTNVQAGLAVVINRMRQCQRMNSHDDSGAYAQANSLLDMLFESMAAVERRISEHPGFLEFDDQRQQFDDPFHILDFPHLARRSSDLITKLRPQFSTVQNDVYDRRIAALNARIEAFNSTVNAERQAAMARSVERHLRRAEEVVRQRQTTPPPHKRNRKQRPSGDFLSFLTFLFALLMGIKFFAYLIGDLGWATTLCVIILGTFVISALFTGTKS